MNSCIQFVPKKLICGHTNDIYCNKNVNDIDIICSKKCGASLDCKHICEGTCGSCCDNTLHQPCKKTCGKTLICAHLCLKKCGEACVCEQICENTCSHGYCAEKCFLPCVDCVEPCKNSCQHRKCNKRCGEICDIQVCNVRCDKLIEKCNHQCIGLCGEPCPEVCKICDPENDIFNIQFGHEDEKNALFIKLDCGHIFERKGLDKYLEINNFNNNNFKTKKCLYCQINIKYTKGHRFSNIIKLRNLNIQQIKKQMLSEFGDYNKLYDLTNNVIEDLIPNSKKDANKIAKIDVRNSNSICMKFLNQFSKIKKTDYPYLPSIYNLILLIEKLSAIEKYQPTDLGSISYTYFMKNVNVVKSYFFNMGQTYTRLFFHSLDRKISSLYIYVDLKEKAKTGINTYTSIIQECVMTKFFLNPDKIKELNKNIKRMEFLEISSVAGGAWYACPNGHYYSIGECGRPMETSTCPQCGASIGGNDHNLLNNNRRVDVNGDI